MKTRQIVATVLSILVCGGMFTQAQDMDTALTKLADNLSGQIKDHGNKKVTVLDLTDLQGGSSELGRYIAEQVTVDMVMGKHDFAVLDRANLKSILAEHKLTAEGLVNPDNAKKLGQFAGVDALIVGNIIPMNSNIDLTVKIITTDTAEIVGAAKTEFKADDTVKQFLANTVGESRPGDDTSGPRDGPTVVKSFGDLRVELQSMHIVSIHPSGYAKGYVLTMQLSNQNQKNSLWVAVHTEGFGRDVQGSIIDPSGNEFDGDSTGIFGVACSYYQNNGFVQATEIQPNGSIAVTMKFFNSGGKSAALGTCQLQLEFLLGHDFRDNFGSATVQNLVAKVEAN